jgi:hypothetical protein
MSFRIDYLPLFRLRLLEHGAAAAIQNSEVQATSQCRRTLDDHRLVAKKRSDGVQVYYSQNPWAATPLLGAINERIRLDFSLRFPLDFFQDYLPDVDSDRVLHLSNLDANGDVKPGQAITLGSAVAASADDAVALVGNRFELAMTVPAGATSFELRGQFDNNVIDSFELSELGSGERLEFDLGKPASGRYRLSPDNDANKVTELFVQNELAATRCHALVSIYLENPQTSAPAGGFLFNARFEAR